MNDRITIDYMGKFLKAMKKALPRYSPEIDQETVNIWMNAFEKLDVQSLREIFVYCRENLDSFPTIKQIRDLCVEDDDSSLPSDPFGELIKAVQTRKFDRHPAVLELASQLGGWEVIGDWQIDYFDSKRRIVKDLWPNISQRWKMGQIQEYSSKQIPDNVRSIISGSFKK